MSQLVLATGVVPVRGPGAHCTWCGDEIPETGAQARPTRRDAFTCSKSCRQASWRFGFDGPDWTDPTTPERLFAYADPPYPGMSKRYYSEHPDYAGEVDHAALVEQLATTYPDGWALSTSSKTLAYVLALIAKHDIDVRIGAWTKPSPPRAAKRGRSAWEPVIFAGGRPRPSTAPMVLDWIHAAPPRDYPRQVVGIKPSAFSVWVFRNLGALQHDRLDDLFTGSGAVGRAWRRYTGVERSHGPVDALAELLGTS